MKLVPYNYNKVLTFIYNVAPHTLEGIVIHEIYKYKDCLLYSVEMTLIVALSTPLF